MYTWKILEASTKTVDGNVDFVHHVLSECSYTKDGVTVTALWNAKWDAPSGAFIAYDDLTEQDMIEWVKAHCDMALMKNTLDAKYQAETDPFMPPEGASRKKPLPWSKA